MHAKNALKGSTLALTALIACTPSPEVALISESAAVNAPVLNLISGTNCLLKNGKLRQCVFPAATLTPTPFETAVPVRTVATRSKSGNCSTPYNLAVNVTLDGGIVGKLFYLNQDRLELRLPGGLPAGSVTTSDGAPTATTLLSVDAGCLVTLNLSMNEPDVDSKEEALAVLATIEHELHEKRELRDTYKRLVAVSAAYDFLRAVSESFHQQLTSETMQELRASALAGRAGLEQLLGDCGGNLGDDDQQHLFTLTISLVALGDPADWTNPDGSTKTLADVVGPAAAEVLASVEAMKAEVGGSFPGDLQQQYDAAALAVSVIEAKLALATAQLAAWLAE